MLALGSCIAGVGLLATGLLALLFRQPDPPSWTRPQIVALLACVPVSVTTGVGLGYAAFGLSGLVNGTGDPRELLVLAGVVVVLVLLWRGLRVGQRLKDYAAVTGDLSPRADPATVPTLPVEGTPPSPEPPAARPSHGAA
jgi:hypothetical protein